MNSVETIRKALESYNDYLFPSPGSITIERRAKIDAALKALADLEKLVELPGVIAAPPTNDPNVRRFRLPQKNNTIPTTLLDETKTTRTARPFAELTRNLQADLDRQDARAWPLSAGHPPDDRPERFWWCISCPGPVSHWGAANKPPSRCPECHESNFWPAPWVQTAQQGPSVEEIET